MRDLSPFFVCTRDTVVRKALVRTRQTNTVAGLGTHASFEIFWLKGATLDETENLPKVSVLAAEMIEEFEEISENLISVEEELTGAVD